MPGDFIPTYIVQTNITDAVTNLPVVTYNDTTYFEIFYEYFDDSDGENHQKIEAILCEDYIMGPYWDWASDAEKANAIG